MKATACLLVLFTLSTAQCAADPTGFVGEPSCKIAQPHLEPGETLAWKGSCKDGYAAGAGVLERYRHGVFLNTLVASYEVTMAQGRIGGEGKIKYENGDTYIGNFKDGQRDGSGYMVYANGDQFEGDYRNDVPNGTGILLERHGARYEGGWKDGKFDGVGTRKYHLGGSYAGSWKAGRWDGKGVLTYAGSGRQLAAQFDSGRVAGMPAASKLVNEELAIKRDGSTSARQTPMSIAETLDRPYAKLTPAQQAAVKEQYLALEEGDEPPFPVNGPKAIYEWMGKAQQKLYVEGDLRIDVLVGKDGNAVSVTTIGKPSPEMAKFAVQVVAKEKYKPAICRGEPCEMIFPFHMKFIQRQSLRLF